MIPEDAPGRPLRRGWTTGACATAAARAASQALRTGAFPDPVEVLLPGGQRPAFALALQESGDGFARAGVVKDAGDDPDVTHGALVIVTVRAAPEGAGLVFKAGEGVGTATRPGLPIAPGEPAINPGPRAMIASNLDGATDLEIEIAIPGGEKIAERTLNGRLGIVGGLSILGTTGIVVPYSCAAWIDSIHRGVDVARAVGQTHIAGATGATSEAAVRRLHDLPDVALIEMGDFVGGMLKYLRAHPVRDVTVAGGVAKISKLGQGLLDLHSRRGEVDLSWLASLVGQPALASAHTAKHAFDLAKASGLDLAAPVADAAWTTAARALGAGAARLEIVVFERDGALLASTGLRPLQGGPPR